jgi:peptide/nickel transport system substrate-binding protein
MRIFKIIIPFIGILLLLCVKVERKPLPYAEKGGILRIGMVKEPSNLNPLFPPLVEPNPFYDLIFQPLFKIHKDRVIPMLAESWEFSEDLKSITFYLRKNVKWHDGKEFTAEDVIFTYNLINDPEINSPLKSQFRFVERVEKIGEYAVKFVFSRIYLYELYDCNFYPLPSHILKDKKDIGAFSQNPIGNGPYKLKRWIKGNLIELEANENYFCFSPPIKTIYFKFYPSPEIVSLAYKEGRIDIAFDITPKEIPVIKEKKGKLESFYGNQIFFIGFNLGKFPYNDINFRKAISLSINKDEIVTKTMENYAEKISSPIPPHHWAYDSSLEDTKFDIERAKKILEDLGFKNIDKDPYLEIGGKDFSMNILTENIPEKILIAQKIKEDLERVGLPCNIMILSGFDYVKKLIERDFDVYLFSWTYGEKVDLIPLWHSKYGIFNFTGFKNEDFDKYLENSILTINQMESKRNFKLAQRILFENLPAIFLFTNKKIFAYSERVKGIELYADSPISNLDLIFIPKAQQEVSIEFEVKEEKPLEEKKIEEIKKPLEEKPLPPIRSEEILKAELAKKEEILPKEEVKEVPKEEVEKKEEIQPLPPKEPQIVAEAKILKAVQPIYPEEAKKLNLKGLVIVRVLVDKTGKVIDAKILKSSNYAILDQAALNAAKEFVFEPVKDERGIPIEFFTTIPFRF